MKTMYQATVASQGGRNGHVISNDGKLDLRISTPKEMGGSGEFTNPEQLFGAGYAACFEGALAYVGKKSNVTLANSKVVAHVVLKGLNEKGGFELEVTLEIYLPALETHLAQKLIDEAHQVCPYSHATRGNILVTLKLMSG